MERQLPGLPWCQVEEGRGSGHADMTAYGSGLLTLQQAESDIPMAIVRGDMTFDWNAKGDGWHLIDVPRLTVCVEMHLMDTTDAFRVARPQH
jgi:hypothetical protein